MMLRRLVSFFVAMILSVAWVITPAQAQVVGGTTTTKLVLYNASNVDVTVMVVCPPTGAANIEDGCATDMSQFRVKQISPTAGTAQSLTKFPSAVNTQAWFTLKRGAKVQFYNDMVNPFTSLKNYCLQGLVFGFGQFGNSCPGTTLQCVPGFPDTTAGPNFNQPVNPPVLIANGSNSFEPTLNMPGKINNVTAGGANESSDISCVKGANSRIRVTYTPTAGGPYWNTGNCTACGGVNGTQTFTSTTFSENSYVSIAGGCDNNCVDPVTRCPRNGVFPYGANLCNGCPDPTPTCNAQGNPACNSPFTQFCSAANNLPLNNGCGFNRSPFNGNLGSFGGTVQVTYYGPLSGGNCPLAAGGPYPPGYTCSSPPGYTLAPSKCF
jgi:hypothetical protein